MWLGMRNATTHRATVLRRYAPGLAAATVGLIVGALVVVRGIDPGRAASEVPMPRAVVASVDHRVVVLDARDGRELRELVRDDNPSDVQGLTTASDAKVYFAHGSQCANEIGAVPADGGPATDLRSGVAPRLSPDGRYLAVANPSPGAPCDGPTRVTITDMRSGATVPVPIPDGGVVRAEPLSWSPDSRHLLVRSARGSAGRSLLVADLGSDPVAEGVVVTSLSTSDPVTAATFLSDTSVAVALQHGPDAHIVGVDPQTGEVQRRLLEVDHRSVTVLSGTPTGDHLLLADVGASRAAKTTRLSRWAESDGRRTTLLRTTVPVGDATWLPTGPPPASHGSAGDAAAKTHLPPLAGRGNRDGQPVVIGDHRGPADGWGA